MAPDQDEDELAALTERMKALLGPFVLRCACSGNQSYPCFPEHGRPVFVQDCSGWRLQVIKCAFVF